MPSSKQDEKRKAMEILEPILDKAPFGVYISDKDARILTVNGKLAAILEKPREELIGQDAWTLFTPKNNSKIQNTLQEPGFYESQLSMPQSASPPRILNLNVINIPQTEIQIGLVRDITKTYNIQTKLEESEAKYRALVETIPEGLIIVDAQDSIVFSNNGFLTKLGYEKNEVLGKKLPDLVLSADQHELITKIAKNLKNQSVNVFLRLNTKFRDEIPFIFSGAPLFDANQSYAGFIAIFVEISQYYHTVENRLFLLYLLLSEIPEQLLRAGGWLDIFQSSGTELDSDQSYRVKKIQENLERINNLLTQSSTVLGMPEITFLSHIPISECINQFLVQNKSLIRQQNCEINIEKEDSVLEEYRCPRVLLLALHHLVQFALSRKSKKIDLKLGLVDDNSQMKIELIDDGKSYLTETEAEEYHVRLSLADLIVQNLGGSFSFCHVMPGEGLKTILTVNFNE